MKRDGEIVLPEGAGDSGELLLGKTFQRRGIDGDLRVEGMAGKVLDLAAPKGGERGMDLDAPPEGAHEGLAARMG